MTNQFPEDCVNDIREFLDDFLDIEKVGKHELSYQIAKAMKNVAKIQDWLAREKEQKTNYNADDKPCRYMVYNWTPKWGQSLPHLWEIGGREMVAPYSGFATMQELAKHLLSEVGRLPSRMFLVEVKIGPEDRDDNDNPEPLLD